MPITVPVDFDANANGLEADLGRSVKKASNSAADEFKRGGDRAGQGFLAGFKKIAGPLAAIGAGAAVGNFLGDSLGEAREAQKVGALTAQVIKTTGGAAKVTAKQVEDLAGAISAKVGIDDEAIQSGANLLLTFKNVRNEVGKGANIFDRATRAAVDLSASGFGDLSGTSKQLGKALNDPIKGISALGRAGVTFTASQKETIKKLVESNDLLGAQKIILKEVESQVGGSAAAQVTASDKAKVAIGNLKEEIGTALLPVVDDLANFTANKLVPAVSDLIQEFRDGTGTGGEIRDVLEDVGGALKDVAEFGKDVYDLFDTLPGPVKKTVVQLGLAYGALKLIQGITAPIGVGITNTQTKFKNLGVELSTTEGKLNKAKVAGGQLGGGLRNLAGAGGMLALQNATTQTNKGLGLLEGAAGGAALGFAIGGPWGAAIGGAAGGLLGIATSGKSAADGIEAAAEAARVQQPSIDALRQTVDDTTGAFTGLTKVEISRQLLDPKSVETAAQLGINLDVLTRAASGNANANKKVQDSLNDVIAAAEGLEGQRVKNKGDLFVTDQGVKVTFEQNNALQAAAESAKLLQGRLGQLTQNGKAAADAAVAQSLATGDLDKALQGIPDKKVLEITDAGSVKEARRKIALLKADGIDVTRPKYKLLMKIAGLPDTKRDLDRLERDANRVARERTLIINAKAGQVVYLRNLLGADILSQLPGLPQIASGGGGRPRSAPSAPSNSTTADQRQFSQTTLATPDASPVVVNQNYYGPTTGRERLSEIDWTLRYSTRARGAA